MKDEGLIPTGTFKARGAAVGVSRARELGVRAVAMPTNGNAGAAWSVYAARAGTGQPDRDAGRRPGDHPARVRRRRRRALPGRRADQPRRRAGQGGGRASASGYQDVSTLKEPYRIEGKKTMGYEIAEQLGWQVPDVIALPGRRRRRADRDPQGDAGDAASSAGSASGCRGWSPCRPRAAHRSSTPSTPGSTRARSSRAPTRWRSASTCPRRWATSWCSRAVRESGGTAIAVSDDAILAELARAGRGRGHVDLPGGCGLPGRGPRAARERLDRRARAGRRAQHRHRAEVPRDGERRRAGAGARRPGAALQRCLTRSARPRPRRRSRTSTQRLKATSSRLSRREDHRHRVGHHPACCCQPRAIASTQTVIARISGMSWPFARWTP